MKRYGIAAVLLLIAFTVIYYRLHPPTAKIVTPKTTFQVELAITAGQKDRGLGYRDRLEPHHGMLFVFDNKDRYGFWMKGMRFPLDFVWLDGNRIADITRNVPVPDNGTMPVLQPSVPVDRVLEINAGEADAASLKIGDSVVYRD